MLKNQYNNILLYLLLWYLYHIVTCAPWFVSYWEVLDKTEPSVTQRNTHTLHFHFWISVCSLFECVQLKCNSAVTFNFFSFRYFGSVFGNLPIPVQKEILNCFDSVCLLNYHYNIQYDVMWCISLLTVFTFLVNYFEYRSMHHITIYRNISYCDQCIVRCIVSWSSCQYPALVTSNL